MKLFIASMLLASAGAAQARSIPTNLEFPLKNGAQGAVYRMADHPNGVFVFEAYQQFCGDCNANAVNVDRLATDYKDNPRVQVLDSSLDTSENAYKEWIRVHKPNHPVISDATQKVFKALKSADTIPQVFIVNCKGEMVGTYADVWDVSFQKEIREIIDEALQTTCQ